MIFRVLERMDPVRVFGKPWWELTREQQDDLIGYEYVRMTEEAKGIA